MSTWKKYWKNILYECTRSKRVGNSGFLDYDFPVITLSSIELSDKELDQLSLRLGHSYIDKNKHVNIFFSADFESLVQNVDSKVFNEER